MDLYNSLTRRVERVEPRDLTWYSCGPTIYNRSHLGHGRTFTTIDLLIRTMRQFGYRITHAMNITDLDDKILNRIITEKFYRWLDTQSKERYGELLEKLAASTVVDLIEREKLPIEPPTDVEYRDFIAEMEGYFWSDLARLGVARPEITLRVSEMIPEIIAYITRLLETGFAYEAGGSVYFDRQAYKAAGLKVPPLGPKETTEYTASEYAGEKKDPRDFVLWKKLKPFEISFDSPWGRGRPGWHIECSTMIESVFPDLDVHAGGIDLKFPHHQNEHLQSSAYSQKSKWARYFFHTGHLLVDGGEKMSQSLNNFETIDGYLGRETPIERARLLRFVCLNSHWRKPSQLSDEVIVSAAGEWRRFDEFFRHLDFLWNSTDPRDHGDLSRFSDRDREFHRTSRRMLDEFENCLRTDFNTPEALRIAAQLVTDTHAYLRSEAFNSRLVFEVGDRLRRWFEVWGFDFTGLAAGSYESELIEALVDTREEVRSLIRELKSIAEPRADPDSLSDVVDYLREGGGVGGAIEFLESPSTTLTLPLKLLQSKLFTLSDSIRDGKLKPLGIKIEDRTNQSGDGKKVKWTR